MRDQVLRVPTFVRVVCSAWLVAVALAWTIPTAAHAGQYTISDMHLPSWQPAWTLGSFPYGVLASGNSLLIQATTTTGGEAWWQSPTLPPELNLDSASFVVNGNDGSAAIQGHMRSCFRDGLAPTSAAGCGASQISYFPARATDITSGVGCGNAAFRGGCAAVRFAVISSKPTAYGGYSVSGLTANVTDNAAPHSVTNDPGYPLGQSSGWVRGQVRGATSAYDNFGSGIRSQSVIVDGDVVLEHNNVCDFGTWVPCPVSSGWNPVLETSTLNDGPHTVRFRGSDAGSNQRTGPPFTLKTDNTPPDTPEHIRTSAGESGWSSVNEFEIGWTNGREASETATQSGIGSVRLDVDPVDTEGVADPPPVTIPTGSTVSGISATTNSATGVKVPSAGAWRVNLAVIDRAGNVSSYATREIGFDPNAPAAPIARPNGWISQRELADGYDQEWSYTANPMTAAPLCGFAAKVSGVRNEDPGIEINVPGDVRAWRLPANLNEGTHWINLRAVNCAGVASTIASVEAKVDLTAPRGHVTGVNEGDWYPGGKTVSLHGADGLSGMAPSPTVNPTDGAHLEYAVNGDKGPMLPGAYGEAEISGQGWKELRFSPVDLAGNKAKPLAVNFGIDSTSPTGHFATRNPEDPRRLRAPIGDGLSGIAFAVIDVRERNGGDWMPLPTSLVDSSGNQVGGRPTSAVASAVFPDTSLPAGIYVARARAYDQAGNELTTSTYANGSTYTFENPMRSGTALSAGLSKAKRTCHKRRGVSCVRRHRGKVVFTRTTPSLSVAYGRGAVVQGFLTTDKLTPLSRAPIEIYTQITGQREVLAGTTSTRVDGSYLFKIKPGMSRKVRVHFPGSDLRQDASTVARLGTGAKLTLKVSKRRARTGQTVTFKGSVTSYDRSMPAAGKIVALQFYAGRRWRPAVAIAHTDGAGRFSVDYRFDGRPVKARIVFRVIAPTEDGWNHSASASRRVTMRVN